jgi:hypothetical protein
MHQALAHYRALHAAALRQAEALAAGQVDRFLDLLRERDHLLAQMDAADLPDDPAQRAEAQAILRAVLDLDAANAALLSRALGAAREEIGTLRDGQRAMRSYRAGLERAARFLDREG